MLLVWRCCETKLSSWSGSRSSAQLTLHLLLLRRRLTLLHARLILLIILVLVWIRRWSLLKWLVACVMSNHMLLLLMMMLLLVGSWVDHTLTRRSICMASSLLLRMLHAILINIDLLIAVLHRRRIWVINLVVGVWRRRPKRMVASGDTLWSMSRAHIVVDLILCRLTEDGRTGL